MKRKYLTENKGWVRIYKLFNFGFQLDKAGYFDERPNIIISATQLFFMLLIPILLIFTLNALFLLPLIFYGYGKMYINLPIKTGIQDCDSASWGINYHGNTLWFYIGGAGNFEGGTKWKTIDMPWQYDWIRTSLLLRDDTWEHETKKDRKSFYDNKWKDPKLVFIETYPYEYVMKRKSEQKIGDSIIIKSNTTVQKVNATITVEEREWRPRWFKWTKLFAKVSKDISIEFSSEVGERTGSWKGGTLGCGYNIKNNETPLECLRRMEKERRFE